MVCPSAGGYGRTMIYLLTLLLACGGDPAPAPAPAPEPATERAPAPAAEAAPTEPTWTSAAPEGWDAQPAASEMRLVQFALPRADGDTEDGVVIVY